MNVYAVRVSRHSLRFYGHARDPDYRHDGARPWFVDVRSRLRFEFHTGYELPALSDMRPAGAPLMYRSYGVEEALELDSIRDGLCTVGLSEGGEVVAGARFQAPLFDDSDAHVTQEFAGSTGEMQVLQALGERIPEAVIEFNGCRVQPGHPRGRDLSDAIARCFVHAMRWLGIRSNCCSAVSYATRRWEGIGGRVMAALASIPCPSEEYQTTLLWDERRLTRDANRSQWPRTEEEWLKMKQRTTVARLDEQVASLS